MWSSVVFTIWGPKTVRDTTQVIHTANIMIYITRFTHFSIHSLEVLYQKWLIFNQDLIEDIFSWNGFQWPTDELPHLLLSSGQSLDFIITLLLDDISAEELIQNGSNVADSLDQLRLMFIHKVFIWRKEVNIILQWLIGFEDNMKPLNIQVSLQEAV